MNLTLLGKLIKLRPSDWADLLVAQAALLRAQLLVWTRPRGTLVTPLSESRTAPAVVTAPNSAGPPVRSLALAVSRAAEYGVFRPNCLVRAVALQGLLQRRGINGSSLHVGVRRQDGALLAHAWVEHCGTVLADDPSHVKQFDELPRLGMSQTP